MSTKKTPRDFSIISEISQAAKGNPNSQTKTEVEKNRSIEAKLQGNFGDYSHYKNIHVNKAMQGEKYKVNFSLNEGSTQKAQYIQALENLGIREYSKIAELAIDVLYELKFLLKNRVSRITDYDAKDIINLMKDEFNGNDGESK